MKLKGPWTRREVERFLRESRVPIRVACNGASGHPVLASLWFQPDDGKFWCATQRSASVVALLEADPRCAFEVSVEDPPYLGVRGSGLATLHEADGEAVLKSLLTRYLGATDTKFARSLLARAADEVAIAIEAKTLVSWDFRARMTGVS